MSRTPRPTFLIKMALFKSLSNSVKQWGKLCHLSDDFLGTTLRQVEQHCDVFIGLTLRTFTPAFPALNERISMNWRSPCRSRSVAAAVSRRRWRILRFHHYRETAVLHPGELWPRPASAKLLFNPDWADWPFGRYFPVLSCLGWHRFIMLRIFKSSIKIASDLAIN